MRSFIFIILSVSMVLSASSFSDSESPTPAKFCDVGFSDGMDCHSDTVYNGYAINIVKGDDYLVSELSSLENASNIAFFGASSPGQLATELELRTKSRPGFNIINCCANSQDVNDFIAPSSKSWGAMRAGLSRTGVSKLDVDAAIIMTDDLRSNDPTFPVSSKLQVPKLKTWYSMFCDTFPNLQVIIVCNRWKGYSTLAQHSPLQCMYSGWANGWSCDEWIGPDGQRAILAFDFYVPSFGRSDGLQQKSKFFKNDGVHLLPDGITYYANYFDGRFHDLNPWY